MGSPVGQFFYPGNIVSSWLPISERMVLTRLTFPVNPGRRVNHVLLQHASGLREGQPLVHTVHALRPRILVKGHHIIFSEARGKLNAMTSELSFHSVTKLLHVQRRSSRNLGVQMASSLCTDEVQRRQITLSSTVGTSVAIASPQEPSQVHLDQSLYGAAFVLHLGSLGSLGHRIW